MHAASIVIVTPALADANNGNWRTAQRWARMLAPAHRVTLVAQWTGAAGSTGADATVMVALHARRSAASIAAWKRLRPDAPLLLALTGTDLYRDIDSDATAQRSLELADALVVLNELGARRLPPGLRARCHVVLQSCSARVPDRRADGHLRVLAVGHLREEKDPATLMRAAKRLRERTDIRIDHIGRALDDSLREQAVATAADCPSYRWLGERTHEDTRKRMQRAHVLVHPSRMEGGAHAVIEALRSGMAVLASRVDGNLGLLGRDWPGAFDAGDDAALARLLGRVRDEAGFLELLQRRAGQRAALFSPQAEQNALVLAVQAAIQAAAPSGVSRSGKPTASSPSRGR